MSLVGNELGEVYSSGSGLCVPGSYALFPHGHVSHDQVTGEWSDPHCTAVLVS